MLLKVGVAMMAVALTLVAAVGIAAFFSAEPMQLATAVKSTTKPAVEPLIRSDPGVDPWVEENIPAPKTEPGPEAQLEPRPEPEGEAIQESAQAAAPQPKAESKPKAKPAPDANPTAASKQKSGLTPEAEILPAGESGWSEPTDEELEAASEPRRYNLPSGAIMGLTVPAMDIYNVPVFGSTSQWALTNGAAHEPETSLPWSQTPERNVYLVGHRLGYSETWSSLLFYHLDKLGVGDRVLVKDRDGGKYKYRVTESFVVDPEDTWVMGRVRDRDLLTLQTCTPIPAFDKRLIVRAERV